mmetsp:Transcript_38955/g.82836  ORF Transcript_38955/g.82836 Transcript_38955/m.82836 type:complete len:590 (-) Transcript_38955:259-2028(-)
MATMVRVRQILTLALLASIQVFARRDLDESIDKSLAVEEWNVFDYSGPKVTNISQGSLGDCYFLAGMAAIAHAHPKALEKAFKTTGEKSESGRQVYELEFLIDGQEKPVAIDDMVPIKYGRFLFAKFYNGNNAWPILLEKGYAKLSGSYLAMSGGFILETFKAILQCPVDEVWRDGRWTDDFVWNFMKTAIDQKWPVGAGTGDIKHSIGTASGHAYAVIGYGYKNNAKALQIYNPWGSNVYKGRLAHATSKSTGDYWIALDEFRQVFEGMTRARYSPTATLTSLALNAQAGAHLVDLTVRSNKPFYVQLEFPSQRILPTSCEDYTFWQNFALMVVPADKSKPTRFFEPSQRHHTHRRVNMPGGAGKYTILAVAGLPDMPSIKQVVLNVYAEEKIDHLVERRFDLKKDIPPLFGLCQQVMGKIMYFEFQNDLFLGSPYWKHKSGRIAWLSGINDGFVVSESKQNFMVYYTDIKLSNFRCYSRIKHNPLWLADEAWYRVGENDRLPRSEVFAKSLKGCNQKEVEGALYRHYHLNNYKELMDGQEDKYFPPNMDSIGQPGVDCGDSATGETADCGKLNHWGSISETFGEPSQ